MNLCLFKRFCQEMGTEYEVFCTTRRFVGLKGQVLKCFFELREEVSLFLKEEEIPLLKQFERKDFIHGFAYLADIFNHTNKVNFAVQGPKVTITDATEESQSSLAKLPPWKRRLEAEILANLRMLVEMLQQC